MKYDDYYMTQKSMWQDAKQSSFADSFFIIGIIAADKKHVQPAYTGLFHLDINYKQIYLYFMFIMTF